MNGNGGPLLQVPNLGSLPAVLAYEVVLTDGVEKVSATEYGIDPTGNLHFSAGGKLLMSFAAGEWKRVKKVNEAPALNGFQA